MASKQPQVRHDSSDRRLLTTVALESHLQAWNDNVHHRQLSKAAKGERLASLARDMTNALTVIDNLFRAIAYRRPSDPKQLKEVHF